MCIDYCFLNAMKVKRPFSLLVIDELLDELSGASWFTKLDLRASFNQIRMAEGREYKTTFSILMSATMSIA